MNTLEQGFRLLAASAAMSYGYGFSPQSQWLLNEMIREGVTSLRASGEPTPMVIKKAQDDLILFVFDLVIEAQQSQSQEIQENIVEKIKKKLCPLPPWLKAPCPQ